MSNELQVKIDWAFKSVIIGLLVLLSGMLGYYFNHLNENIQIIENKQTDMNDRLIRREENAFTIQDATLLQRDINHNTQNYAKAVQFNADMKLQLDQASALLDQVRIQMIGIIEREKVTQAQIKEILALVKRIDAYKDKIN